MLSSGKVDIIAYLIQSGANPECRDLDNNNAIGIAVSYWRHQKDAAILFHILKLFIAAQVDINHKNICGWTAYDLAQSEVVRTKLAAYHGTSGRLKKIDHLFTWDVEKSRDEWNLLRRKMQ